MSLLSRYSFSVKPQEAILIVITMFWGGTFLAVQYAVTLSGPFFFVGVQFCHCRAGGRDFVVTHTA